MLNRCLTTLILSALVPTAAWAEPTEPPLKIYASVYGFAAKLDGHVALGSLSHRVDQPFSDTWSHLDKAYMAYIDVTKGRWGGYIDKQYVKTTSQDRLGPASTRLKTKLDRTSVGTYVTAIDTHIGQHQQRFTLAPTLGVHFTSVTADLNVEAMGLTKQAKRSSSWAEPYIGTRFVYDVNPQWNLAGQVDVGTRHSKGYQAYVGYRTKLFNQPTNVRIGYRTINQKHHKNDFTWDIKQSGPVFGLSMQLL